MYDLDKIEKKVKKYIDEKRFVHTKGVEFTAAAMAMRFGHEAGLRGKEHEQFIEKARVAALLHDNAKNLSDEELLEICSKKSIEVSDYEKESPYLLHGKVGAYYASKRYDIEDEEILLAIKYHTTGRPSMTLLEKIIFISDYIEPGRYKQQNLDEVRYLAFTDIDRCVYRISEDTLVFLQKKGKTTDDHTVATKNYYEVLCNEKRSN